MVAHLTRPTSPQKWLLHPTRRHTDGRNETHPAGSRRNVPARTPAVSQTELYRLPATTRATKSSGPLVATFAHYIDIAGNETVRKVENGTCSKALAVVKNEIETCLD